MRMSATLTSSSYSQAPDDQCICGNRSPRPISLRKNGFDISRCNNCGVGRTIADHFDPVEYYEEGYFTGQVHGAYLDYAGSESTLRREFCAQVEFLRTLVPSGKLLEVGCAYGFFMQEA